MLKIDAKYPFNPSFCVIPLRLGTVRPVKKRIIYEADEIDYTFL
ncbi:MAG: hypothetical protein JWR18_3212 [Segetibacter sp.]|nr:hypothetical protein [Segetibacter sp.]